MAQSTSEHLRGDQLDDSSHFDAWSVQKTGVQAQAVTYFDIFARSGPTAEVAGMLTGLRFQRQSRRGECQLNAGEQGACEGGCSGWHFGQAFNVLRRQLRSSSAAAFSV